MSLHYPETLFSFELFVEYVTLERHCRVSEELALGVRLLDFPTLLIYQHPRSSRGINQPEHKGSGKLAEHAFNRGKSCLFKMSLSSLRIHLASTPLHALVLDVAEETPRLVGSSVISLAKATERIWQDAAECGIGHPSSHKERGLVSILSLTGERLGALCLSYKLVCLGASLQPQITERRGDERTSVPQGELQEYVKEKNKYGVSLPLGCGNVHHPSLDKSDLNIQTSGRVDDSKMLSDVSVTAESQAGDSVEADLTLFCPPPLYYSNTAQEESKSEEENYRLLNLDMEAFTFEDSSSENEEDKKQVKAPSSPGVHKKVTHIPKMTTSPEARRVTPNILREALQQLPLLNALVAELSQLNGQSSDQDLTLHPSQTLTHRPLSAEPLTEQGNTPQQGQNRFQHKSAQQASTHLKHLQHPRSCSTPIVNPASVKKKDHQDETLIGNKSSSKFRRKNLVYGTTKTFNLRLKLISPLKGKHRECMELVQNETQTRTSKGKTKLGRKTTKSSKRKSVLNQISDLNENIETAVRSFTADSEPQDTTTLKQKTCHAKVHVEQAVSEKVYLPRRDLKLIHIPSVDTDSVPLSKDEYKHHSYSDPAESESDRDKIESSQSSIHSRKKSSFSECNIEGNEEVDYVDDFDSLESSDIFSPDHLSSPEPSRAKTPKSSVHPDLCKTDSTSASIHRRKALLPQPVRAPSSPQRALMGTYIIPPHAHTSALSFSSDDDDDRDGQAPLKTVCSRKQTAASDKLEKGSRVESFISSNAQKSDSAENCDLVQRFSAESISSFEAQEGEELEDGLGSLDFRKEYKHISELVASKLPGYTM